MSQINPPLDEPFSNAIHPGKDGHPPGLFLLFFVEMWERFSFYGMKALLLYYLIKGFMKVRDEEAYGIIGAYGALVYATPYIGGMLADRFLGARLAVVWGGILMAAGHLLMTIETREALFGALGLLIVGNGLFKPNISTMVGSLYSRTSTRRDAGFTIFYMGINLGAALAPLVCGYVGETYGWHYGFGLATIGMLLGVATFVVPTGIARFLILFASLLCVVTMAVSARGDTLQMVLNVPIGIALLAAGAVSFVKLGQGTVPADLGRPRDATGAVVAPRMVLPILIGSTLLAIPFAFLVDKEAVGIPLDIPLLASEGQPYDFRPGTWILYALGLIAGGGLLWSAISSRGVERTRMFAILILCFFSMLFWAFFEQGATSVSNFTDRNVDRVTGGTQVKAGQTYSGVEVTQEFLGIDVAGRTWTLDDVDVAQKALASRDAAGYVVLDFKASEDDVTDGVTVDGNPVEADKSYKYALTWQQYLSSTEKPKARLSPPDKFTPLAESETGTAGRVTFVADADDERLGLTVGGDEVKASVFQAVNPIFIILLGPVFSWIWGVLGRRDPSAGVKFALGLGQLAAGFGCLWIGATNCDSNGMVALPWLILGLLLHTTGELCLSPVGLSLVTKISPARIVSTVMGAWFLATSFSYLLAAAIAKMTGVKESADGTIPPPLQTVGIYGEVFGMVGLYALGAAALMLLLAPLLNKMMAIEGDGSARGGH
jgi:POT family proton-dependent oligopeptide transporter